MEILIGTTIDEIDDRGCWDTYCKLVGWKPTSLNHGLVDPTEVIILTPAEADEINFVWRETKGGFNEHIIL